MSLADSLASYPVPVPPALIVAARVRTTAPPYFRAAISSLSSLISFSAGDSLITAAFLMALTWYAYRKVDRVSS